MRLGILGCTPRVPGCRLHDPSWLSQHMMPHCLVNVQLASPWALFPDLLQYIPVNFYFPPSVGALRLLSGCTWITVLWQFFFLLHFLFNNRCSNQYWLLWLCACVAENEMLYHPFWWSMANTESYEKTGLPPHCSIRSTGKNEKSKMSSYFAYNRYSKSMFTLSLIVLRWSVMHSSYLALHAAPEIQLEGQSVP